MSTGEMNLRVDAKSSMQAVPEEDNAVEAGANVGALQPSNVNLNVEKSNKRQRSTSPEDENESRGNNAKVSKSARNPLAERRGVNVRSIHTEAGNDKENWDPAASTNVVTPAGGLLAANNRTHGQGMGQDLTQQQQLLGPSSQYAQQAAAIGRLSRSNTPAEAALAHQSQQSNYFRLLLEQQMRQQQLQSIPLSSSLPAQPMAPSVVTPASTLASASSAFFSTQTSSERNVNSSPAQNLQYLEFQHQQLLESQRQVRLQQQQYQQMASMYQAGFPNASLLQNMTSGGDPSSINASPPSMSAAPGRQLSIPSTSPLSHAPGFSASNDGPTFQEEANASVSNTEQQETIRGMAQAENPTGQQARPREPAAPQEECTPDVSSTSAHPKASTVSTAELASTDAKDPLALANTALDQDTHPSVVAAIAGAIAQTYQQAVPRTTTTQKKKSSRKERKNMGNAFGKVYLTKVSPTEDQNDASMVPGSLMMPQTPLDVNLLPPHARPSCVFESSVEAGMLLPQLPMDILRQRAERMRAAAVNAEHPETRDNAEKIFSTSHGVANR